MQNDYKNYLCSKITMQTISSTNFNFPNQTNVYHGKVRDVYFLKDKLVLVEIGRAHV